MRDLLAKTGRHGLAFSASFLLSRMAGFVLVPFLTAALRDTADFGIVDTLALAGQLIAMVAAQGVPSGVFRAYAYSAKTAAEKRSIIVTGFRYALVSTLLLGTCFALFAGPMAVLLTGDRQYSNLFILVLLTYFCSNLKNVCTSVLRADLRAKAFLTVYCGEFLLCVGLNIYFVLILRTGLAGIIYSNLIGAGVALLLGICFVPQTLAAPFDSRLLKGMLKFALPLVPSAMALWFLDFIDRFFFLWLLPEGEGLRVVGVYGRGVLFASILQAVLITPLTSLWPSVFYDLAKTEDGHRNIGQCASYYAAIACFLAVGLGAVARPIVAVMTPQEYHGAWVVIPILAFSIVMFGATEVAKVGFFITGKTQKVPFLVFGAVLVNVVLNVLLIPAIGMPAAAWSSVCAYTTLAIVSGFYGGRLYRTEYEWGRIVRVLAVAAVTLAACLALPYPEGAGTGRLVGDLFLRGGLAALVFPCLLLLSGYLTPEEKAILREKLGRR